MYVDDMLIIGKKAQIRKEVKIQHNLADYLGCEFYMNTEKTRGWLGCLLIGNQSIAPPHSVLCLFTNML